MSFSQPAPIASSYVESGLAPARGAATAAFATQGLVFISLSTRLPTVQAHFGLHELGLSGLLLMLVLFAGLGSMIAEQLARRHDSATVLRLGLGLMALSLPGIGFAQHLPVLMVSLSFYGAALGCVDASTNMQAVALEHRYQRTILPSFHGAWTIGGITGSVLTLSTTHLDFAWISILALAPAIVIVLPLLRRVGDPLLEHARAAPAVAPVPWRPIVLVGMGLLLFYMVDTAALTWGPTYLDTVFATPSALVALATFPYLVASGFARLSGDHLVDRFGSVRVIRAGAVISCAALAVVVFAPTWPVAVVGFTLLGAGAAVIAPLSFSAAARIAGGEGLSAAQRQVRVDAVVARFNQFNYAGALLGAVLTGLVGSSLLRIGFAVPMVLVLGLWFLARYFVSPTPTPAPASAPDH